MASSKLTEDERRWRIESDADTLRRYSELTADKRRLAAATKYAQKMADTYNKAVTHGSGTASSKTRKTK